MPRHEAPKSYEECFTADAVAHLKLAALALGGNPIIMWTSLDNAYQYAAMPYVEDDEPLEPITVDGFDEMYRTWKLFRRSSATDLGDQPLDIYILQPGCPLAVTTHALPKQYGDFDDPESRTVINNSGELQQRLGMNQAVLEDYEAVEKALEDMEERLGERAT